MIRKITLLFVVLFVISCSSRRVVIQTSKSGKYNPQPTVVIKKVNENNNSTRTSPDDNSSKTEILEATTRVKVTTEIVLAYISKYKDIAKNNMKQFGIPSSICIGQGILESGAGTGPLSSLANNHFGIKCHKDWTGASVKYDDDSAQECFRKYNQASESYNDHALFLKGRKWYEPLFKLDKGDYKGWAKGLKAAGYATDPKYPEKLIAIIERYHLDQYDAEVLGNDYVVKSVETKSDFKEYQVSQGDTLYSISKKFNVSIDDLKKKNNISDNALSIGQSLIVE
jgi:flagellum-specific peptidoglycan hydrolase FlgJ